jgi:hypothetical protein
MVVDLVVVAFQHSYVRCSTTDALGMKMKNPSKNVSCVSTFTHIVLFRYSSFVRIGSGLSFADYVWVRDKPWKTWDPKNPPDFLQTAKKSHEVRRPLPLLQLTVDSPPQDKGDVYLLPEESVLVLSFVHPV